MKPGSGDKRSEYVSEKDSNKAVGGKHTRTLFLVVLTLCEGAKAAAPATRDERTASFMVISV